MISPFYFLIVVFASFRVTWFFTHDSLIGADLDSGSNFSQSLRLWRERNEAKKEYKSFWKEKVYKLLICPYCVGFWISLAATCIALRSYPWTLGIEGWFTAWAVAGAAAMCCQFNLKMKMM